jgi:CRISPR-associated endonuclease/helicase Cas3
MSAPIPNDQIVADAKLLSATLGLAPDESPFPWQKALLSEFVGGRIPRALDIPTGLGKTAVMAIWLVARLSNAQVPRRLVYVVDRRAVVDQATTVAIGLRQFVESNPDFKLRLGTLNGLPISTLRGQYVDNREWLENPASPAIIVGTVDMIGSRLLFEGYGVSRKMRPYHAGMLGADTLIVLDEAHLVPPFEKLLESISKKESDLQAANADDRMLVPSMKLLSLSATGRSDQPAFELGEGDLKPGTITYKRLTASKRLKFDPLNADETLADALARNAWELSAHGKEGVKIIVFANKREDTVKAKQALETLAKGKPKEGIESVQIDTELLVGGRRVHERETTARWLTEHGFIAGSKSRPSRATFVFATSAGEVGIDLDADHLVGDLVQWERMVQRLGRVNRRGEGRAKVVIIQEPERKPTQGEANALKKAENEREAKDLKTIDAYHEKLGTDQALAKPFDLLPTSDDGVDVSPCALRDLKRSTMPNPNDADDDKVRADRRALLVAATSESPLRPALTRPLVDAWAMTSLPEHTGRPKIQPWLRGWEDDEPQTTVIWRSHLPFTAQAEDMPKKLIRDFFEAAPPHSSEELETETRRVFAWLKKRAEAIEKAAAKGQKTDDAPAPLRLDEPFAIILKRDGEPSGAPISVATLLADLTDKKAKETFERRLYESTIVINARFAGLDTDGLLDDSTTEAPLTLDDGKEWLAPIKGEPAIRFRVRPADEIKQPTERGWRHRLRVPIERSVEGEPLRWLLVEKWRNDSSTADDGAAGNLQTLADHQASAVGKVDLISQRLGLPQPYATMLAIAARLHDEGKRADKWQDAFNAPQSGRPFAKTPGPINQALLDSYRHEFSSLAVLATDPEFVKLPEALQELGLHIVAAHHGFARPLISIQGCADAPPSLHEARAREIALRFVRLQNNWGPWGLAWWESLLRAADQQASRELEITPEASIPASSHV